MTPGTPLDLRLGDILLLKKLHPCGSQRWQVMRLGADIRLSCLGCHRVVMMPRSELAPRLRSIQRQGENGDSDRGSPH